jgi:hypothetical protein
VRTQFSFVRRDSATGPGRQLIKQRFPKKNKGRQLITALSKNLILHHFEKKKKKKFGVKAANSV